VRRLAGIRALGWGWKECASAPVCWVAGSPFVPRRAQGVLSVSPCRRPRHGRQRRI